MWGAARRGRWYARARAYHWVAAVLLTAVAVACASSNAFGAQPAHTSYRVQRLCGASDPATVACTAMRLVPDSQSEGVLQADAAREAEEAAAGAVPAVDVGSPLEGFLTPSDLHAAYALPNETAFSATQTVALIDAFDDPTAEADLGVYDGQFGLPACTAANGCFRKVNEQGRTAPLPPEQGRWAGEISIDVQMVHAICEDCRILLVEAESAGLSELGAAVNTAAKAGASEISNSYQVPEEPAMTSFLEELESEDFEHPAVVLTASSGDCGYLNEACPGKPVGANFPASSPHVIGVGGTTLTEGSGTWNSTAWSEGGSGCSQIFGAPAWQRSATNFSATGCEGARSVADLAVVGDPRTGVDIYDSTPEGTAPTGWTVFGGTSVGAPIIAAAFALAGGAQGVAFPAATLYSHAGDPGDLFDIVSGSNGSCGGATACGAAVGYDGPSGLGSPIGLGAFAAPEAPALSGVSPSAGITGSSVMISGSDLDTVTGVVFGALPAQFKPLSSTEIEAIVPNGARKGTITLTTAMTRATGKATFKPTLSVVSFAPRRGAAGTAVTVKGVGFNSHSRVSFDGVSATVDSASAKKLKVTVPPGAGAGPIAVTNTAPPVGTVLSATTYTP
jgi:IPT/TIG domain